MQELHSNSRHESQQRPAHILCVDDYVDLGILLQFALQRQGYRVTVSQSVQQALGHLNSQRIDLLMTDLKLPDGSGTALCREVRQNQASVPIIVLTGRVDVNDPEMKAQTGADVYLAKPVELDQLIETVGRLLDPHAITGSKMAPRWN